LSIASISHFAICYILEINFQQVRMAAQSPVNKYDDYTVVSTPTNQADKQVIEDVETIFEEDKTFSSLPWHTKLFWGLFYLTLALASLYFFMVAVKWIGDFFTSLLGCEAKDAFDFANNPVAGFMIGTIATTLFHSPDTVTPITVDLVGASGLTVRKLVPITMGVNVGRYYDPIM